LNETKYLVDNNALIALTGDRIRSEFFRSNCRVTADVLWEAYENPEQVALSRSAIEFTSEILEQLRAVMKSVAAGDTGLVDLYKNKGAADPGLIASVLDAIAADDGKLFFDTWVLVTNDHAVAEKAAEFSIAAIKPDALAELIDAALE
jgi:hypothetical protein